MERGKPFKFERPRNFRCEHCRPRRSLERALSDEHKVERAVRERNPASLTVLHQRRRRLLRDPYGVGYADLPQREDIAAGGRLHTKRHRRRREEAACDEVLEHGRIELNAADPVLAGVALRFRHGASGVERAGPGSRDGKIERRWEKAEAAESAGLPGEGDDVREA